jgi:hypothetical protein
MVLHQMYQLGSLFRRQFSKLNPLLANGYRAERTFLFNPCVTDKLKGNVLDVQLVLGDKDIEGLGAVGRTFIGQVRESEPAKADILNLTQLVRFLSDGGEYAVYRFESFLSSAVFVIVINQF